MPPPGQHPDAALLEVLGLDLESTLSTEPRFLMDGRFLGALHAELREQLGARGADGALFQMAFVHGLHDGAALVQDGLRGSPWEGPPATPRIAMRIAPRPAADGAGGIEIDGSWPERHEAEAVLMSLGVSETAVCAASAGYTSGWLSALFSADVLAVEQECSAAGADGCRFLAREAEDWKAGSDERAGQRLEELPFSVLRELVGRQLGQRPEPRTNDGIQAGAPVVHVWGPVMVIPFAGVDESLRALDLIGNDPAARSVRVVVVDLTDAVIDEGFGAVALEQILGAVEAWGAEVILSGLSPQSARVVEDLEHSPLVCHKDLPGAVAAAFRIAEAQRLAL